MNPYQQEQPNNAFNKEPQPAEDQIILMSNEPTNQEATNQDATKNKGAEMNQDYSQQTRPTYPSLTTHAQSSEIKKQVLDVHRDLQSLANDTLEVDEGNQNGITISVCGHLQKGSGLTKYTVYLIKGEDKNGPIEVYRRFNEFWQLRQSMKQRWPGCFIPAVPDKNALGKNDQQTILNRERFLNDFVKKMAKLSYLYYGDQFQELIRSKQIDISVLYTKWPKPTYDEIITKYRDSFSQLAGKQINKETVTKIMGFATFLRASQGKLPSLKQHAKSLAITRSNYDARLAGLFNRILPEYQKTCLFEYTNGREQLMIYGNSTQAKVQQHGNITKIITKKNPYWLVYDLIKLEERDGEAFLQAIQAKQNLQTKKHQIQIKIRENEREIEEMTMGKTTLKSLTSRGSKDQIKYRLEQENKDLKKDSQGIAKLSDIIGALQAYITIDQYRQAKKRYYVNTLKKVAGYEINFVQNMVDIWTNCEEISSKLLAEEQARNQSAV